MRSFEAGEGGELAPLMCVDKPAAELASFDALCAEAAQAGPPWAIVFTAALSGRMAASRHPAPTPTRRCSTWSTAIKAGRLDGMLPFNRAGEPVHLA